MGITIEEIFPSTEKLLKENKNLKKELHSAQLISASLKAKQMESSQISLSLLERDGSPQTNVLFHSVDSLNLIKKLAHEFKLKQPDFVHFLLHKKVFLVSLNSRHHPTFHAGKLLKVLTSIVDLGSSGGGNNELAQGSFSKEIDVEKIIEIWKEKKLVL